MPDELYQRQPSQVGPGLSHHMEPVGFKLADVRRLADTVKNFHERGFSQQQAALAPFAHLLKEVK